MTEASVGAQDSEGRTPLHWAAYACQMDLVDALVGFGAETDTPDNAGRTALMYACYSGSEESVKMLLDQGADADVKDKEGKSAYNYAVSAGHLCVPCQSSSNCSQEHCQDPISR